MSDIFTKKASHRAVVTKDFIRERDDRAGIVR
jgi:hypothetical protein